MSQEETVKLADKLWDIFYKTDTPTRYDDQIRWNAVSKHVQKIILEAKIEHLSHIHTLDEIDQDIERLQRQLEPLNKTEE